MNEGLTSYKSFFSERIVPVKFSFENTFSQTRFRDVMTDVDGNQENVWHFLGLLQEKLEDFEKKMSEMTSEIKVWKNITGDFVPGSISRRNLNLFYVSTVALLIVIVVLSFLLAKPNEVYFAPPAC